MTKRILCLLTCLTLLASCAPAPPDPSAAPSEESSPEAGTQSAAPLPADDSPAGNSGRLYRIYREEGSIVIDARGKLLADEAAYTPLYDLLTGEEAYRCRTRSEDTGEDDEYGNPVVQRYSALYDTQGNLLYDWEPVDYRAAFSGLLIRQDAKDWWSDPRELGDRYQTALWNPKTGETLVEGIDTVSEMGDGSFFALDVMGRLLGVLDGAGRILSGFPAPEEYFYPNAAHGFFSVGAGYNPYGPGGKPTLLLLDRDFNILLEKKELLNLSYYGLRGPYLLWREENREGILSLPDLTECYTTPEVSTDIEYFDGERMILRTGSRDSASDPWRYTLCDAKGTPLTQAYDRMAPEDEYESFDLPAARFLAEDGDTAVLLDRGGAVLASIDLPGLDGLSSLGDGRYTYEIELPAADPDGSPRRLAGLLGSDFTEIIPSGTYQTVQRLRSWGGRDSTRYDLLDCGKELPNGVWRHDLLDLSGKPILQNLSVVGDVGPDGIAVVRGFTAGLVDFSGNWIAKHSIYSDLQAD